MAPHELKQYTQSHLRQTRDEMLSLPYLLKISEQSASLQRESALKLSDVQIYYLRLRDAELSDIREKLMEKQQELEEGIKKAKRNLGKTNRIKEMLSDLDAVLTIVGRVVSVLG